MHNLSKEFLIKKIEYLESKINIYKYDNLTGLLGMHDFKIDLNNVLGNESYWLRLLDINGLHIVNNNGGYIAGNKFIIKVVNIINNADNSEVYRIGGDEFCIIYKSKEYPDDIKCDDIVYSTTQLKDKYDYEKLITLLSKDLKIKKNKWYEEHNINRRKQ